MADDIVSARITSTGYINPAVVTAAHVNGAKVDIMLYLKMVEKVGWGKSWFRKGDVLAHLDGKAIDFRFVLIIDKKGKTY